MTMSLEESGIVVGMMFVSISATITVFGAGLLVSGYVTSSHTILPFAAGLVCMGVTSLMFAAYVFRTKRV